MQPSYRAPHPLVWAGLAAAFAVLGFWPMLFRPALPDVAWPLYLAEQVLEGAQLGRDYVEVNPPLFVWLSLPPVVLGRWLGLDSYPVLLALIAGLAAVSLTAAWRLLAPPVVEGAVTRRGMFLVVVIAILVLPRRDFSEREHLALMLTVPWVLLAARRAVGGAVSRPGAMAVGVAGALGFALKPYFLAAWLLVEVWLVRRLGWRALRRPESVLLVAAGVAYLAAVLVLVPAWLPMALELRPLYDVYLDNGILQTLLLGLGGPLPMMALVVGFAHFHVDRRPDALRAVLLLATLGFLAAAVVQQKGWRYHYVAAMGYGLLLLAHTALRVPQGRLSRHPSGLLLRLGRLLAVAAVLVTSGATIRELVEPRAPRYLEDPTLYQTVRAVRRHAGTGPIMVFSSNPASGWPLTTMAGARWASRYMSLWPLAGFYHDQIWGGDGRVSFTPFEARAGLERRFHDQVIEDLLRHSPTLLVVLEPDYRVRWGGATQLDYLAYFGADQRFAEFFSRFEDVGRYGLYRLYRLRS